MNREDRRKLQKKLSKKGYSSDTVNQLNKLSAAINHKTPEGSKVKLDIKTIKSYPDYKEMNPKYKQFIEDNVDKIFTVEYDERYKDSAIIVTLKEDETDPKWLWSVLDLKVVDETNNINEVFAHE